MYYSVEEIKETYQRVHDLLVTKYIIKSYSTNTEDIRRTAINDVVLNDYRDILELGCGYGFFIEALKGRLHDNATIIGIDLVENNRDVYLQTIDSIGYRGKFIKNNVEIIENYKTSSFDLIVACYSLYFFPQIIDQISRILKPGGLFIAITHSQYSLRELIILIQECMTEIGFDTPECMSLQGLIKSFSLENGKDILNPYFSRIELIEYKNSMIFSYKHVDDCIYYIEKKRQLLYKEVLVSHPEKILDLEICLSRKVYEQAKKYNEFIITKDDAIFRCIS